jgi:pyrimidine deaminase RibD-like protein
VTDRPVLPVRRPAEPPVSRQDLRWLAEAIALARRCPPSPTAFSVGAVVVGYGRSPNGERLADGWSRRDDPHDHAEEVALRALATREAVEAATVTVYSSLEPCSARASRQRSCTELILAAGIRRVVFAWREPALFLDCDGAERLREGGVEVIEVPGLAQGVKDVNAHLL